MIRSRSRRDREPHVVATVLASALLVVAALALLLRQIATPWQLTIAVTSFAHYLLWAAPLGLVAALTARRPLVASAGGALTVIAILLQVPPIIATTAPSGGRPVVVMQANLKLGRADARAITQLVRDHHVDLLATEELTAPEQARLVAAGLPALLPHRFTAPVPHGAGLGMWSRFPLSQQHKLPGFRLNVLTAHVSIPSGPGATFLAVHLLPPYPFPAQTWRHEVPQLGYVLAQQPQGAPVLAAGDYNATIDHPQFRGLLGNGYADAAGQAGAGYPATYPNDVWYGPLIAIDHVLTRNAVATSFDTYGVAGSDHRAVIARIVLAQPGR